eukprot:TRINITY_DN6690_c0_g1_i8.p1 TRINITY_DN6690_c0_g1~~TRINITY_DN6690_c0_g1_i8.p1  ORF type:complete len:281 (+),score=60.41 TRINITY_DN6690_c0_g1_i8:166-1008(+)
MWQTMLLSIMERRGMRQTTLLSIMERKLEEVDEDEGLEEELFRVGANADVMATLQKSEDAYLCARQTGEPLSEDLQSYATYCLYKLISYMPGCLSEHLHAFHLSLSLLSELDATFISRAPASTTSDVLRDEVLRTCMAIANMSLKQASSDTEQAARDRLQQWTAPLSKNPSEWSRNTARVVEREREVFAALKWLTWRPTAAVWLTVFQARLDALRGKDPSAEQLCDGSLQSLAKVQLEEVVRTPPRQLAASVFARTARSLGLEQELAQSFKFATGTDLDL